MSNLYSKAAERLWEKIEFRRQELNMSCLDGRLIRDPWNNFCKANPKAKKLVDEVNSELNYELSEAQCSWAVLMAYKDFNMNKYNQANSSSLSPRA